MKKSWTTSDILKATNGDLLCGAATHSFANVSIDSRQISEGDLFVAIIGDTHDGHRFVSDVIKSGISGIMINRNRANHQSLDHWKQQGLVCVVVDDTVKSLGDLAAFHRRRSNIQVIAITGSNGKTTTKDMTTAVVARRFATLSTHGNFNNEIGLPLTLFKLEPKHQWAVLELGTNGPGEIKRLAEICQPDIGVITNIGPAHLEGLGSLEGVLKEKGELLSKIKPDGKAVLNADDPSVVQLRKKTSKEVLYFGLSDNALIRAMSIKEKEAGVSFALKLPSAIVSVDLKTPGDFMVSNALAASAVGSLLGLSAREIKAGLEDFRPSRGRMNVLKTKKGVHIIDDSYNANPVSMEAAMITLKCMKGNKRGILVAGDMFELGDYAEAMHQKIGSAAARSDIKKLYVTGEYAATVAKSAQDEAMDPRDIFTGTMEAIFKDMTKRLQSDDWVLVKGSRGMGMEKIVNWLLDWANDSSFTKNGNQYPNEA
jgi:UDP-N-acetylmuramoyl-tripeptide--D-alanyl-D-alanine ligase